MSAAKKASKSSPHSSGESASSETGSPRNKGSVSGLQAISSKTQSMSAELAMTSKTPHRGKPPLASRCKIVHPASYHNEHRSEHVRDRLLNGSAHGEASKQIQSKDILESKNKMKHLFTRTNTEKIIDSERPSSAETMENFLGGAAAVPHLPTSDKLPSVSEEKEEDDDLSDLLGAFSDLITFSKTVRQSNSVITSQPHSLHRLQNQKQYSLVNMEDSLQKRTSPTDTLQSSSEDCSQYTSNTSSIKKQIHTQECQVMQGSASVAKNLQSLKDCNKGPVCRPKQRLLDELPHIDPSSAETMDNFLRRSTAVPHLPTSDKLPSESDEEEDDDLLDLLPDTSRKLITLPRTVRKSNSVNTSQPHSAHSLQNQKQYSLVNMKDSLQLKNSSTDTLQSSSEAWSPCISDSSNMKEPVHTQEYQAAQSSESAAEVPQSQIQCNRGPVCRPKQRLLEELSHVHEVWQCRFCLSTNNSPSNPLLSPCLCSGSLQFVHSNCLKTWIKTKLQSGLRLHALLKCELCMGKLTLDSYVFDLGDFYKRHDQQQQIDYIPPQFQPRRTPRFMARVYPLYRADMDIPSTIFGRLRGMRTYSPNIRDT